MDSFSAVYIDKNMLVRSQIHTLTHLFVSTWKDLLERCIVPPMDSDDQIFGHSCYILSSERREEDGKANKSHRT